VPEAAETAPCQQKAETYSHVMTTKLAKEISKLTAAEKIQLAGELWNDVAENGAVLEIPDEHKVEMERRQAESLAHPGLDLTWAEFQKRFAARL